MPEIKVVKSEIEPVIQDLKAQINQLNASKVHAEFSISALDFVNKIKDIEREYNDLLKSYKSLLLKNENDAWTAIEKFIKSEEQMARTYYRVME
ncbi:DUF5344 family protein [Camelliibacillus cellulosilyticus]|uniref:DUF5344 family protein n=1 Tax=Camelliibacillus cellulosilyticus TaxID=2174486 RepID=A0ABV9GQE9_9BACL